MHLVQSTQTVSIAGNLGDLSVFSFTPHKIITTGQGGMVLTNSKKFEKNW